MSVGQMVFQWSDALWIPAALIAAPPFLRVKAVLFVVLCMIGLRLQIEVFTSFNLADGIFHLLDAPLFTRGLVTYSIFIFLFLLLTHLSARVNPYVYIAAMISIFIFAFCVSALVMIV